MAKYVTLRVYDTVMEAAEVAHQLARGGIAGVRRSGTQVQVDATYTRQARAVLAGSAPPTPTVATGASAASDTAHHAASTVVDTAQHGASSAAKTVQDATHAVTRQASTVTSVAADTVQAVADSIRHAGSSPDVSGVQRHAAQTTASVLDKTAHYRGPGGLHTLVGAIRSSIQRHPLRSLVIGVGVGYLLPARYFRAHPTPTPSTPPVQPSTPIVPPIPPTPGYGAVRTPPDVPVSTSTDRAPAPLVEPRTPDPSRATADRVTPRTLIGDDVVDTDRGLGITGTTDGADTGLDTPSGTSDRSTAAVDRDRSVGVAATDRRTAMADAARGDTSVDVLGSDTLLDARVRGDRGSMRSTPDAAADTTFTSASPTPPVATDAAPVYVGQRIRVNVPGIGDHGQLGTIKKVRGNQCFVRLDWDQRLQHVVMFYAKDLDPVPDTSLPLVASSPMQMTPPAVTVARSAQDMAHAQAHRQDDEGEARAAARR